MDVICLRHSRMLPSRSSLKKTDHILLTREW